MRFAIRDDDVSYFTEPESLKRIYHGIWETIPISFAVIPFIQGANFVPKGFSKQKRYPVGRNNELVKLLKKKISQGRASIMLHGYTHRWDYDGHEFEIDDDLYEKVKEGKQYLEKVFDTEVKSFVAPNHAFSRKGMKAVIDNGLSIVGSPGIMDRPVLFDMRYILNMKKLILFRLFHDSDIRYPFPIKFKNHKELYCYGIRPYKPKEIDYGLRYCKKRNGVFCLGIHNHSLGDRITVLRDIVKKTEEIGAEYCTVDEAFE